MSAPTPGQLARCQKVIWPGARFVLGEIDGGGFGIWSMAGGEPVATYPQNDGGWHTATQQWIAWERPPAMPQPRRVAGPVSAAVVVLVLVVIYIAYHSYKYQNCIVTPGLFSWPNRCI